MLSGEQIGIVEAPLEAKILVTAGAGTGKTLVLISRLAKLIEKHRLLPGKEVLVLSFSRSAVMEIRKRLQAAPGNVRFVRAQTFDSFGTRLLSDVVPNGPWVNECWDYEDRIRRATELIRENTEAEEQIKRYAHVFVDEIQDLVGDRVEMVKAILEISATGFTLLGDPAQGIYNFQLEGKARKEGSAAFYRWLREHFPNDLREVTLSENYRAKTEISRKALWAGPRLNDPDPNYPLIKNNLEATIMELQPLNKPEQIVKFLPTIQGKTAILCRNNGQALLVSRCLWDAGISHCLQRQATDRVLPKWIGGLFYDVKQSKIGKTLFTEKYTALYGADDVELGWRSVKRIEDGPAKDTMDLRLLAQRIQIGAIPDELCEPVTANLVVSTIHRAKGTEFERVAILVDESHEPARYDFDLELPEETRVLYVALTRCTSEMYQMIYQKHAGFLTKSHLERWVVKYNKWKYADFEIRGDDVHHNDPPGGFPTAGSDALELQRYIAENVKSGDKVELVFRSIVDEDFPGFSYEIVHNGTLIGIMSRRFALDFFHTLSLGWKGRNSWPSVITGARVETLDTVSGTQGTGRRCGLGESDIWLRVRVSGLGHLKF